ncbi:TPA: acyltransferase [Burkholderia cepacia]|nr:hypothetical protein BZY94_06090 [Burkholderia territorii]HDR9497029.1 acyltransferase [Burkholderia cepacia]
MSKRILSLQAFRAVGAIAVVIYHCASLGNGFDFHIGASGVDLFFIISGIVMALSVDESTRAASFAWRRFVRVVPLYWIATAAAAGVFCLRAGYAPDASNIIESVLFLPPASGDRFPLLYPGWSLNYEIAFYALIGAAIPLVRRPLWFAFAVTLTLGIAGKGVDMPYLQYYCEPKMLEFALGLLIGMLLIKQDLALGKIASAALLVVGMLLLMIHASGKGNPAVDWGLPWAMILASSLAFESSRAITAKSVQFLGEASYSIYLSHPFVIWGIEAVTQARGAAISVAAVVLCVLFGAVVYVFVESPMLTSLHKIQALIESPRRARP